MNITHKKIPSEDGKRVTIGLTFFENPAVGRICRPNCVWRLAYVKKVKTDTDSIPQVDTLRCTFFEQN